MATDYELPANLHILFIYRVHRMLRRFILNFTERQRSILDLKRAKKEKSPWVKIKEKPGLRRQTRSKNRLTKTKKTSAGSKR